MIRKSFLLEHENYLWWFRLRLWVFWLRISMPEGFTTDEGSSSDGSDSSQPSAITSESQMSYCCPLFSPNPSSFSPPGIPLHYSSVWLRENVGKEKEKIALLLVVLLLVRKCMLSIWYCVVGSWIFLNIMI